ncbi:MAG: hypothetical protein V7677_18820, partial [Motiliproteus sp.]
RFSAMAISCLLSFFILVEGFAASDILSGKRDIILLDKKGEAITIGQILFSPLPNSKLADFEVHLDHHKFTDHFLSMKEMKCLEGPELWCRIPYPYANSRQVSVNDLRWLEHDLLFLFKRNKEFGANFWNGIYYRLQITDQGIDGEANAVDLNFLASPPDDLTTPPIGEGELDESDNDKRWLPVLQIR